MKVECNAARCEPRATTTGHRQVAHSPIEATSTCITALPLPAVVTGALPIAACAGAAVSVGATHLTLLVAGGTPPCWHTVCARGACPAFGAVTGAVAVEAVVALCVGAAEATQLGAVWSKPVRVLRAEGSYACSLATKGKHLTHQLVAHSWHKDPAQCSSHVQGLAPGVASREQAP